MSFELRALSYEPDVSTLRLEMQKGRTMIAPRFWSELEAPGSRLQDRGSKLEARSSQSKQPGWLARL